MKPVAALVALSAGVALAGAPGCAALNPLPTTEELKSIAREIKPDLSELEQLAAPAEPEDETPYVDDEVLERRVEDALRDAGRAFRAVRVTASAGTVTLAGTVATDDQRRRAADLARDGGRVRRVVNELRLEGG